MENSIKRAIVIIKSEEGFAKKIEENTLASHIAQAEACLEAAKYFNKNADQLIDEAVQIISQKELNYLLTAESQKNLANLIEFCLNLIQYSLIARSTKPIDECLISELDQIKYNNNFLERILEALDYLKNHHILTDAAAREANQYIDRTFKVVEKAAEKKNTKLEITEQTDEKPFWQRIIEIGAKVPKEEWDKLPRDFSRNFEHYMYGAPKEE